MKRLWRVRGGKENRLYALREEVQRKEICQSFDSPPLSHIYLPFIHFLSAFPIDWFDIESEAAAMKFDHDDQSLNLFWIDQFRCQRLKFINVSVT